MNTAAQACSVASECSSLVCTAGHCAQPTCGDGVQNQDEVGTGCKLHVAGPLADHVYAFNHYRGTQTGVDCGGDVCDMCSVGDGCLAASDCVQGVCDDGTCAEPTCADGVHNGARGVRGLPLRDTQPLTALSPACAVRPPGNEGDVDCGGSCVAKCDVGQGCAARSDCTSGSCSPGGVCAAPSCDDLVLNGDEVGV